jgi:hypothetical protein
MRVALVRVEDASASLTDDSVLHFAAENPDQAAITATTESITASVIESHRSRRSWL